MMIPDFVAAPPAANTEGACLRGAIFLWILIPIENKSNLRGARLIRGKRTRLFFEEDGAANDDTAQILRGFAVQKLERRKLP